MSQRVELASHGGVKRLSGTEFHAVENAKRSASGRFYSLIYARANREKANSFHDLSDQVDGEIILSMRLLKYPGRAIFVTELI